MTLEDLREHDVLLPEEEWGEHRLQTTVAETPLLLAFIVASGSLVVAYAGDGGLLTWIGISTFLVLLFAITWMCDRAVLRQRRRTRREHGDAAGGSDGHGTAPTDGGTPDPGGSERGG